MAALDAPTAAAVRQLIAVAQVVAAPMSMGDEAALASAPSNAGYVTGTGISYDTVRAARAAIGAGQAALTQT